MVEHSRPPMETKFRQVVVDSFGIPPALMDPATAERIRGTFAYHIAEVRDSLADLRVAATRDIRQASRRSGRRPW